MIGLGAQEILLLLCCAAVPVTAAALVFVVLRLSARNRTGDDFGPDMDSDDPNHS